MTNKYYIRKGFVKGLKGTLMQIWKSPYCVVLGQFPPRKIAPPTPQLTLTQSLTLTEGQCFSGEIVCLPPNPKTKPNRKTPTLTEGQFSSRGEGVAIFRIPFLFILK